MATYEQSTLGRSIVINEGIEELPVLRIIMIMVFVLFAILLKFNEALVFWANWLDPQNTRHRFITFLYILYTLKSVLHIVQSIDSMSRPVDYFEPKFLYQKYMVSTMELPFIFNLITLLLGYFGFTQILMGITKRSENMIRKKCRLLLIYIIFSMSTLLHYRQEPPHSYSPWINTIIIGGAITGLMVTTVVTYISYLSSKNHFSINNTNISLNNLNNFIHINENYINTSDDEELETYNKNKVQLTRQRSRSRTPTKTTVL